jgi:hypothetical protein
MAGRDVSAGWLLLGILAIAFVGSSVARGRGVRGFGLPSGSEWLLCGVVFGPQLLGFAGPNELKVFAPLVASGGGWVALLMGQRFGLLSRFEGGNSVARRTGLWLGVFVALLTATFVALVVFLLLGTLSPVALSAHLRWGSAWAIGIAVSGSTRQLIDWARERLGAAGSLTDLLEARVSGAELVALLGTAPIAVLFFSPNESGVMFSVRVLFPVVLGILLGKVVLLLLGSEVRRAEVWGILLGAFLLATGLSLRFGASVMTTGFVLGWTLSRDRRIGYELRSFTHPTEGAVILPLLVVAGASVDWARLGSLAVVVGFGVAVPIVVALLFARAVRSRLSVPRVNAVALGLTLSASGEVTCISGLGIWLIGPSTVGQVALASVVLASLVGELFSAWGIRALVTAAGEVGSFDGNEEEPVRTTFSPGGGAPR